MHGARIMLFCSQAAAELRYMLQVSVVQKVFVSNENEEFVEKGCIILGKNLLPLLLILCAPARLWQVHCAVHLPCVRDLVFFSLLIL